MAENIISIVDYCAYCDSFFILGKQKHTHLSFRKLKHWRVYLFKIQTPLLNNLITFGISLTNTDSLNGVTILFIITY